MTLPLSLFPDYQDTAVINQATRGEPDSDWYRVLVVDPPWNQGKTGRRRVRPNQGTDLDYPTMSRKALLDLPITKWAHEES